MNYPYAFIPILAAVVLLYIITWGLGSLGQIKILTHRRIWNTLLLIAFLVSGSLGLFLVIQINYKLEIPWIKKVLKWHVDFGIGLVGLALIHLGWHLRYYRDTWLSLRNRSRSEAVIDTATATPVDPALTVGKIIPALVVLGFSCIITQLIAVRELLNVFQGNELIIGMIFSTWMLLTAAGSQLGYQLAQKANLRKYLSRSFLLSGILPAILISLLYLIENQLFPPGTTKGPVTAFFFCLVLLAPYCLTTGMLFAMLATALSLDKGSNRVSQAYSWESAGSTVAGLIFGLLAVYRLGTFQVLALILMFHLGIYILLNPFSRPALKYILPPVILTILSAVLFFSPADRWIKSLHFVNQKLVYIQDTPFGSISVTETAGQYNFYGNNTLMFSTENPLMYEEAVHFAMLQHRNPENVLLVSGGISGMTREVLKYDSVRHIDYVEINPWLVSAEKQFSEIPRLPCLDIHTRDARRWISKADSLYDVMIITAPDPSNAQINRYYTREFFAEAKNAMRPGGVLLTSLSPTGNYISASAKEIQSIIYRTLKGVFRYVEVIPGERNYYIAADNGLRMDIARAIGEAGIENDYVQPGYIEDDLLLLNSRLILNEVASRDVSPNLDMAPRAYLLQIQHWLSIFQHKYRIMLLLAVVLILVAATAGIRNFSNVAAGIFAGGFAGASCLFLILIMFQILFGHVYQMLGILIASYMTGLTAGSGMALRETAIRTRWYILLQWFLLIVVMLLPAYAAVVSGHVSTPPWIKQGSLFILTAVLAFVTGLEFNMACRMEQRKTGQLTGSLYGVDLAGAAGGTLLVSLFLYPAAGLMNTCFSIAAMIMAGIAVMIFTAKRHRK